MEKPTIKRIIMARSLNKKIGSRVATKKKMLFKMNE